MSTIYEHILVVPWGLDNSILISRKKQLLRTYNSSVMATFFELDTDTRTRGHVWKLKRRDLKLTYAITFSPNRLLINNNPFGEIDWKIILFVHLQA